MEKTKLIELTNTDSKIVNEVSSSKTSIFELVRLKPLSFIPHSDDSEAVAIARTALTKRCDSEIITIARFITKLIDFGEGFAVHMMHGKIKQIEGLDSVRLLEARTLFTLRQFFSVQCDDIPHLKWSEIFSTLVLMQAAQRNLLLNRKQPNDTDDGYEQAVWQTGDSILNEIPDELLDSLARLECIIDIEKRTFESSSRAGKAKAKNMEPLIQAVYHLFVNEFSNLTLKKASESIFDKLKAENSKLLYLSHAENKPLQFAKWIGQLINGEREYLYKN